MTTETTAIATPAIPAIPGKALRKLTLAAAKKPSRYKLDSIAVTRHGCGAIDVWTTDGHRIHMLTTLDRGKRPKSSAFTAAKYPIKEIQKLPASAKDMYQIDADSNTFRNLHTEADYPIETEAWGKTLAPMWDVIPNYAETSGPSKMAQGGGFDPKYFADACALMATMMTPKDRGMAVTWPRRHTSDGATYAIGPIRMDAGTLGPWRAIAVIMPVHLV